MLRPQVVAAACDALRRRHGKGPPPALDLPPSAFITALLVPRGGAIALDLPALQAMGIRCGCACLVRNGTLGLLWTCPRCRPWASGAVHA